MFPAVEIHLSNSGESTEGISLPEVELDVSAIAGTSFFLPPNNLDTKKRDVYKPKIPKTNCDKSREAVQ